jgi:hypothetical protein
MVSFIVFIVWILNLNICQFYEESFCHVEIIVANKRVSKSFQKKDESFHEQ